MKKLFFSFWIFFFGMIMAQAQPIIKQAVGINFTDVSKDESTSKFKPEDGWLVGGSIMLGEKKFYLKPGIFYVQKSINLTVWAVRSVQWNKKAHNNEKIL